MGWREVRLAVLPALAVVLASCAPAANQSIPSRPASSPIALSIQNSTTMTVTLVVNGTTLETVAPETRESPVKAALPPLPWQVETRSPSGRVLSTMSVHEGDAGQTALPDGGVQRHGDVSRVDLSCGMLVIWVGDIEPIGPVFSPGPSGDCA